MEWIDYLELLIDAFIVVVATLFFINNFKKIQSPFFQTINITFANIFYSIVLSTLLLAIIFNLYIVIHNIIYYTTLP